ncbi:MAG TPA: DJ-1/PfpI family protein [Acidobacteriaceae bacterium]|nr:DJ-1/PfpI family protein [Acidobacteriaceae bacterium]
MATKTVYVLLRNGYADWEPASAMAELRRTFGFSVQTIGLTAEPIISMGGLKIVPDISLSDFAPQLAAILILAGGDAWMEGEVAKVSDAVNAMISANQPVAAICAATLALAHAALLDDRQHTSNGRGFIEKYVREYRGQRLYRVSRAVTDRLVTTANGLSPFAFAAQIFRALAPEREQDIETYENLYSRGLLD